MDELRQNEFAWEPFVGRGALGGTIGMLVVVAIGTAYVVLRYGTNSLIEMIVIMGVMGLVSRAITGLAVGYVIYRITVRRRAQLAVAVRVAIGIAVVLAYELLTSLTSSQPFHPTFVVAYAIGVGGLAGLLARPQNSSTSQDMLSTRA